MQIERHAKRFGALPQRISVGMIEILAVGVAVDHGAGEFQIAHAALEFVGRGLCVLHRKMREAEIAVRRLLHLGREKVVGLARHAWSPWRCRGSICTPGPASESTDMPMPEVSIAESRCSPKSFSRASTCP